MPGEGASALKVSWPEDGGAGAVIVRYREVALPPDVMFLSAGDVRSIPLGGVARVDWVVAGAFPGGALNRALRDLPVLRVDGARSRRRRRSAGMVEHGVS